jgi:DNA-binding NtrC family response regulator
MKEDEMDGQILEGRRIFILDNEREVVDMVVEAFASSQVVTAGSLDEARPLIAKGSFDLAILDTVAADGCALLKDCHANKLPAAMLTAREVEVKRLNMAMKLGAMSFFPKSDLHHLPETVAELLEGLDKGKTHGTKLFLRFGAAVREVLRVAWEEFDQHPKFPRNYY